MSSAHVSLFSILSYDKKKASSLYTCITFFRVTNYFLTFAPRKKNNEQVSR